MKELLRGENFEVEAGTKQEPVLFGQNEKNSEVIENPQEVFQGMIGSIIENFRRTKNRQLFYAELDGLRWGFESEEDGYLLDRSWSQGQVAEMFDLIESSLTEDEKNDSGDFLPGAVTTSEILHGVEKNPTVSDLVTQYLIDRVHQNRPLPYFMESSFGIWAQNIQMANPDLVNKLLLAAKNNPGVLGGHFLNETRAGIAFYGEGTINRVVKVALDSKATFAE